MGISFIETGEDRVSKRIDKPEEEPLPEKPALIYELREPIKSYGEEVSVIEMRAPNGGDLLAVGNPVIFFPQTDPIKIEHDYPKVLSMVSRLANIPSSSLAKMDVRDIIGISWAVTPFFAVG